MTGKGKYQESKSTEERKGMTQIIYSLAWMQQEINVM